MALFLRLRTGVVMAVIALAAPVLTCAAAGATVTGSAVGASSSAAPSGERLTSFARPAADPVPAPSRSVPSDADVAQAQEAAAAAAKEVADITAEVGRAQARLMTLQRGVSDAVAAHERARQQLVDAEASVRQATVSLTAAHWARDAADRSLSATAALMYMQGSDLQNLTTLVLSPPSVMSDLSVVLDRNANRAQSDLDTATSATVDAIEQERQLTLARDDRDAAAAGAAEKLAASKISADEASAEAAELGAEQERLTARLAELKKGAADLVGLREAAARLGGGSLLGLQANGPGPKAAQEIARAMMASRGWDEAEFTCLVALWHAESGWSWSATNPSSGAYGIPQALPAWKMGSAGSDWLTNPATQITWGMDYISSVYGSPCQAYDRFLARSPHWY